MESQPVLTIESRDVRAVDRTVGAVLLTFAVGLGTASSILVKLINEMLGAFTGSREGNTVERFPSEFGIQSSSADSVPVSPDVVATPWWLNVALSLPFLLALMCAILGIGIWGGKKWAFTLGIVLFGLAMLNPSSQVFGFAGAFYCVYRRIHSS